MSNMTIVAYSDNTFNSKVPNGDYSLMLNPEKIQWTRSNTFSNETRIGSNAVSLKFSKANVQKLSFETVIDCTGVVDSKRIDMATEVNRLSQTIYTYNGKIHQPNFLIVKWGTGITFNCVLTSFNLSYTLFNADGNPLRARITLEFSSYMAPALAAKAAGNESPDMTHLVNVIAGVNLPQISQRIYRSPLHAVQIAQFNGLNKFRHLKPGQVITVPPLVPVPATRSAGQ